MKEIKVKDILEICDGILICGDKNETCQNFSKDTRQICIGDVYVGIKGENFNGSTLYEEALKQGAKICLLEDIEIKKDVIEKYPNCTIITVKNTITAIQKLARYKRSLYDIPVIAVTGSVGKTSTKDMIASVVSKKYNVLKTEGNYNNHIGLPLTILKLKDHNALVVEMGMNNLGEISLLTNIAKPTICVITNVGTAHIGILGSRENILKAKLEILEGLSKNGTVIINNDNDLLHKWNNKNNTYNVTSFGIENESNIMAEDINIEDNGSEFITKIDQANYNKLQVKVPVTGIHFVYNALCAMCVGITLQIPKQLILEGINDFELSKNRMEIIKNSKDTVIISDCYNANYDSMKASLEALKNMKTNRTIAVLGDMLELGEYSKELHEKVGIEVAKNNIDILITVGTEAKHIAKKAIEEGIKKENIYIFETTAQAINKIQEIEQAKDVILVKASNGMNFKEIIEHIK